MNQDDMPAMQKMHEGLRLMQAGQKPEALEAFLWCWDHGLEDSPAFFGVKCSFLIGYMKILEQDYAPCAEAMRERKQSLLNRLAIEADNRLLEFELEALERQGF